MSIVIKEDFLSELEITDLVHSARTLTTWDSSVPGYWNSRIAHADQLWDNKVRHQLVEIRKRVRSEIIGAYHLIQPIFADTLQFVRWPEGYEQQPHADSENPGGVSHPYHWRSYASLIYLNNDFEGGRIYFPHQRLVPQITPGMLVFFPGTLEYLHGVSRITRGQRFTVASFWTFDPARKDGLPL
jgi:hypothetical protein